MVSLWLIHSTVHGHLTVIRVGYNISQIPIPKLMLYGLFIQFISVRNRGENTSIFNVSLMLCFHPHWDSSSSLSCEHSLKFLRWSSRNCWLLDYALEMQAQQIPGQTSVKAYGALGRMICSSSNTFVLTQHHAMTWSSISVMNQSQRCPDRKESTGNHDSARASQSPFL